MPAPKDPVKYAEWCRKLKKAKENFVPWNKGVKYSEDPNFDEYREKLSEAQKERFAITEHPNKGKSLSEERKAHLSRIRKGKRIGFANGGRHSEATKRKMSEAHKGISKEPLSEEQKKQISETLKQYYRDHPEAIERLRNRELSEESKSKMSKSIKAYFQTDEGKAFREYLSECITKRQTGKPLSDEHKAAISKATARTIMDGTHNSFFIQKCFKSGYHLSPKAGKVHYRSSYELAFYQILDTQPEVLTYEVETISIPYTFNNSTRTYIPDVKVIYTDGDWEVVEIKPEAFLDAEENAAKFLAAEKEFGQHFVVVTESEIF